MARTVAMIMPRRKMKLVSYKARVGTRKRTEVARDVSDRGRGVKKSRMAFNLAAELGYRVQPSHFFKRTEYLPQFVQAIGGAPASGFGKEFALNNLVNVTEFTSLFDQYRILGINIRFIPKVNVTMPGLGPATPGAPQLITVIDYDNASAPPAIDEVLQYENMALTTANGEIHQRCFKPAVTPEIFQTALATGYASRRDQWLDCNSDAVPHYGIRGWVTPAGAAGANWTWDCYVDYFIEFRNTR